MAFPINPTNGEQTTQNGIVYIYNSTLGVWAVLTNTPGNFGANNITATNTVAGGTLTATGNVGGANIVAGDTVTAVGNISGSYFIGNGSQLTGLPESYTNANVEAYLPTYTGNLASLTGNVTTTANVSGNYFIGNGSQLTGLPEGYGNTQVAAYLPTYTGNLASLTGNVTTTANISGNYILGNGSLLTGIDATSIQNGNSNVTVLANSNVTVGVSGTSNVVVFSTDRLAISGVFFENSRTVTANANILANTSVMSAGPIIISSGVTVTVQSGGDWSVI